MSLRKIDENMIDDKFTKKVKEIDTKTQELATSLADKASQSEVRMKNVPIGLNDTSPELLAAIEGGEGTSFNLLSIPRDVSVSPEKTTFLKRNKNLFNINTAIQGRLNTVDGTINTSDTGWVTSEPIPVKVGQQYKRSHLAEVVQYDAGGNRLTSSSPNTTAFSIVDKAENIRVSVRLGDVGVFQLEEGAITTAYEPFGLIMRDFNGLSKEESARQGIGKVRTIEPYGEDYPDTFHELLPSSLSRLVVANALVTPDYENAWKEHTHGYKIETRTNAIADIQHELISPLRQEGIQAIGMWVYVPEPKKINNIQLYIGHTETGSTWTQAKVGFREGWNLVRWKAIAGTIGNWDTFYRFMVRVNTSSATSVTIGSVFLEQTAKAKLLFVEDGGYVEFLELGYPGLKERGIPTTWALNPGRLGRDRRISEAQVDELALDYMSSFTFHSWASEVHSTMSKEQVADNAIKCVRWLQKKGLKPDFLYRAAITQNNCPNHAVLREIVEAYSSPTGGASLEIFPFENPYGTPRITLHGTSPEQMDRFFEQMKKTHCLMIGYTHGIGVTSDTGQQISGDMTQAEWDYFLHKIDTALSEGWLEGVTYDQLRKRYSRPSQGWGIEKLYTAH